jgi:hypothetical protein
MLQVGKDRNGHEPYECSELFRSQRKAFFAPAPNTAVHGEHVGITHLLQIVGGQCGTVSTATIEDERRVQFRYALLDVAFDDALAQMNRSRQVIFGIFTLFPNVDQQEFVATVKPGLDVVNAYFSDPFFGIFDNL